MHSSPSLEPYRDGTRIVRDWLRKIARNLIVNYLTRQRYKTIARGDTAAWDLLLEQPCLVSSEESLAYDNEMRRSLFQAAAQIAKLDFKEKTWEAFWRTAVLGVPIAEVSKELELTIGNIYVARSRVLARIQAILQEDVP
jgi:RNA polymerase sigma-70 factor, ECF subfamily